MSETTRQITFSGNHGAIFPEIGMWVDGTELRLSTVTVSNDEIDVVRALPWEVGVDWEGERRRDIGPSVWRMFTVIPILESKSYDSGLIIEGLHATDS